MRHMWERQVPTEFAVGHDSRRHVNTRRGHTLGVHIVGQFLWKFLSRPHRCGAAGCVLIGVAIALIHQRHHQ